MKKTVRRLGTVLILAGLLLLFCLGEGHLENRKAQDRLMDSFESIRAEAHGPGEPATGPDGDAAAAADDGLAGLLEIPKIDLQRPVLDGATPENLDLSLGSISGLDDPAAEGGSLAIAGHQTHVFGEYFSRIDELEPGDRITYETSSGTYTYEVFRSLVVYPHEVSVLDRQDGITLLSLVTCWPKHSSAQRLIVQAKQLD
ncbi:class D sortase [Bhargavaea ullalensis]|uniref:Sortase A n=1 Tax=Bhargavaea ullalensis TaxID=1265685 RepID=A0ABV2G769_9BACL